MDAQDNITPSLPEELIDTQYAQLYEKFLEQAYIRDHDCAAVFASADLSAAVQSEEQYPEYGISFVEAELMVE